MANAFVSRVEGQTLGPRLVNRGSPIFGGQQLLNRSPSSSRATGCRSRAGGRRHGDGAAGVGGCARLPSSAAGMRSISSTRLRCARTLRAVSENPSGIPGNTMGLATGTSARLRAGHDVCRAPGSAARWGRAGRKLAVPNCVRATRCADSELPRPCTHGTIRQMGGRFTTYCDP